MLPRHDALTARTRRVAHAATAAVLAVVVGCGGAPPPARGPHAIRYRLAWTWGRAQRVPDGWTVRTDRGVDVRVTRGWVVPFSLELVECPPTGSTTTLLSLLAPRSAWAFHSANAVNPSTLRSAPVESLGDPVDRDVGDITLPPQAYCAIHYLVARATRDSAGLPADVDMVDRSLWIDGTWRRSADDVDHPITLRATVPNARLQPLPSPVDTGTGDVVVVVTRDLGTLFDGIDFDGMPTPVVENRVLANLVQHARLTATPAP
jgi:hypothetical protein